MFKVGDRVMVRTDIPNVNSCADNIRINGKVGTVKELISGNYKYSVTFDDNRLNDYGGDGRRTSDRLFRDSDLVCRSKATRLAKKMYPDARVSECGEGIYV